MKINLTHEKKTILILSLFALAALVIVFFIIWPTVKYIRTLDKDTSNLKEYLQKRYDSTHNLKVSKKRIEEIKTEVEKYDEFLFFKGEELKLIGLLEDLSVSNRVIQKINSSDLGKNSSNLIHISLTVSGNYNHLLKYLSDLEKIKYFVNIQRLQISPGSSPQNQDADLTIMNLDLLLYAN
ncbi:MAG: hypothetical protein ACD_72C00526G0003 [uncultured bacterium]|nr:MAG: hypothetical protein ACD_72C00526G0003 [uncultured bacterium]